MITQGFYGGRGSWFRCDIKPGQKHQMLIIMIRFLGIDENEQMSTRTETNEQ
jgi:hypothetical protein